MNCPSCGKPLEIYRDYRNTIIYFTPIYFTKDGVKDGVYEEDNENEWEEVGEDGWLNGYFCRHCDHEIASSEREMLDFAERWELWKE